MHEWDKISWTQVCAGMQDICSGSSIEVGGGISRVGQSRPRHWMWDLVRAGDGTGRMEKNLVGSHGLALVQDTQN